jgi:hypothetical protein
MVAFMKADLAAVDRKRTPWVVALVHKDWTMQVGTGWHPLALSLAISSHHSALAPPLPSMQANAYADFNNVLESGGVDLLFCGHVHYYNR